MTELLTPHPFLVLTNAEEQENECPQHSDLLPWAVQGHGASGAQYVLQGLKGFASQQMMQSKSRNVFTQRLVLLLRV